MTITVFSTPRPNTRPRTSARGALATLLALAIIWLAGPAAAQSCICLRCALLSHRSFLVPASSMHPTIPADSCVEAQLLRPEDPAPAPGNVVTFVHPITGIDFISRLVASEGQSVQMIAGRLHIDGQAVEHVAMAPFEQVMEMSSAGALPRCPQPVAQGATCEIEQWRETLPNGTSYPVLNIQVDAPFDDTEEMVVPPGHVFVLGDNRDNSIDSRLGQASGGVGMLPVDALRGVVDRPATTLP